MQTRPSGSHWRPAVGYLFFRFTLSCHTEAAIRPWERSWKVSKPHGYATLIWPGANIQGHMK
jgi:hypothetical protein